MRALRRAIPASLFVLAACNSIVGYDELQKVAEEKPKRDSGKEPDPPEEGDAGDSKPKTDGATPAGPRCDPAKPFGEPKLQTDFDGAVDTRSAIMTRDELEIFYLRVKASGGGFELRHAIRARREDKWGAPATEVLSPDATYLGAIVAGGLKLYYWRALSGTDPSAGYVSTRPKGGAFSPGNKYVIPNARPFFVSESDDSGYWADIRVFDGGSDKLIQRGNVGSNGILQGVEVPGIHEPKVFDDRPVLNAAETTLLFSSGRAPVVGGSDIWMATRPTKQDTFGAPVQLKELNGEQADAPTWLSDDGCVVLLDRNSHWYRAERPL